MNTMYHFPVLLRVCERIDRPCSSLKAGNNLRSCESGISQGTYNGLIKADMPLSSSMFDL